MNNNQKWQVVRLEDIERRGREIPVREHLGIHAFGINAYTPGEAYQAIDWGEAWPFHRESLAAYGEQRYADALEAVRGGLEVATFDELRLRPPTWGRAVR